MGLLDALNSDEGMQALGLLAAAGPSAAPMSFGQRLFGAMQQDQARRTEAEDRKMRQQMQRLQMEQLLSQAAEQKRMRENENKFRGMISSPQMDASQAALAGGGGPTVANAAQMKPVDPMQQLQFEAMRLGQIKPLDYINAQRKDTTPMKLGAGEVLIDPRTYKPLFTNPKEQAPDEFERALRLAGIDPASPQGRQMAAARAQKMATHQPATNVNVNTEKPLLNSVASKLGEQIDTSLSQARAATQAIGTAQTLKSAIDSGKVVAGPGAKFRVAGLQLGQTLGVGGKDAAEVLGNTRTVIQSLAKAELSAAEQMKGQGQITEAERDIIRRASTGDIDSLTTGEIRLLADAMEKTARSKIASHQSNVRALGQMKDATPLLPFYQVEAPPAYEPAAAPNRVRRYNPATGRLE